MLILFLQLYIAINGLCVSKFYYYHFKFKFVHLMLIIIIVYTFTAGYFSRI